MVALAKQPNMWNEPVQVKHGDIYQLDRHRIACLDAFDPITFEVLLEGKRPHAIITDPPYGSYAREYDAFRLMACMG